MLQDYGTPTALASLLLFMLTGCASKPEPLEAQPAGAFRTGEIIGLAYATPHYLINTTVQDRQVVNRLARVLESAHAEYRTLIPSVPERPRKLKVYCFATYDEWAAYTRAQTGDEAEAYLSVWNGGYALRDEFVCWLGHEPDTLSVAAHEGLHQFVARHFRNRLPPTLEEGLATTYENVTVTETAALIHTDNNPRRQRALARALEGNYLIPLETLLMIHAGDLSGRNPALIEGYYAQAWALARLLRDDPRYRPGFLEMMNACATGNQAISVGASDGSGLYDPNQIVPLIERHLPAGFPALQADYDQFVRTLASGTDE